MRHDAALRDRWRATLWRAPVSDATRILLLLLADHMRTDGHVSVPRAELAATLGRTERRVNDRIKEARAAGLLDCIAAGRPGRTAEYVALLPKGAQVRPLPKGAVSGRDHGADLRPTQTPDKGAQGCPTSSKGGSPESAAFVAATDLVRRHGWDLSHCKRVVSDVLARAPGDRRIFDVSRYVIKSVESDLDRHAPVLTPPQYSPRGIVATPERKSP